MPSLSSLSTGTPQDMLRALPQVEEVLQTPRIESLLAGLPRPLVVEAVRCAIEELRQLILEGTACDTSVGSVADTAAVRALALTRPSLRRVVNASGVIIHTNLGRSPLAPAAIEAALGVARGYSTLEYDTDTMARGSRHTHCEDLICALTGAEAALAVNNNAAAVMMVLSEFAAGHEAVVSRGELVEIGGSFRIPDIMALSQATMHEVGTTNKTHEADYARAIGADTAMLLKVHPSNYRLVGFTQSVGIKELRALADSENLRRGAACGDAGAGRGADAAACGEAAAEGAGAATGGAAHRGTDGVVVYEDQGSGALIRLDSFGSYAEPSVAESLRAGCDIVSFSGDKLLGGPQAGIIVGSRLHITRLKANPLARALRADKMTLAALEATLRLYLEPERALAEIPTLRMLAEPAEAVRGRAEELRGAIEAALPRGCARLGVVEEVARAGGGALPLCDIPTFAVRVEFVRGTALGCDRYLVSGRDIPVVARLKKEALLFDARTILCQDEMEQIAQGLAAYFKGVTP